MILDEDLSVVGRGASVRRRQLADSQKHGQWQRDLEHMALGRWRLGTNGVVALRGMGALSRAETGGLFAQDERGPVVGRLGLAGHDIKGRMGAAGNDTGKGFRYNRTGGQDSPDAERCR